jgi:hypothetical protein
MGITRVWSGNVDAARGSIGLTAAGLDQGGTLLASEAHVGQLSSSVPAAVIASDRRINRDEFREFGSQAGLWYRSMLVIPDLLFQARVATQQPFGFMDLEHE